jgi:hypothetical protein
MPMKPQLLAFAVTSTTPRTIYNRIRNRYLVPMGLAAWRPLIVDEDDFRMNVGNALDRLFEVSGTQDIGDYLEFGVSRGTSMACVHMVLAERGLGDTRLIGFDSFEGMPPESAEEGWKPGAYASTIGATRRYLAKRGVPRDRIELIKGWFDDTATPQMRDRLGIRHCRLATSTATPIRPPSALSSSACRCSASTLWRSSMTGSAGS